MSDRRIAMKVVLVSEDRELYEVVPRYAAAVFDRRPGVEGPGIQAWQSRLDDLGRLARHGHTGTGGR